MIDIQYVRDNPELVEQKAKQKGYPVDVQALLVVDSRRKEILQRVEELRAAKNKVADEVKAVGRPTPEQIEAGKNIKVELAEQEDLLSKADAELMPLLKSVPNMPLDSVPVGATEDENIVIRTVGEITKFDFVPKSHAEIGQSKDWIDKERAAKVAGARFAYIKGDLVTLQMAIISWVMSTLADQEFMANIIAKNNLHIDSTPFVKILPPAMIKTDIYDAMGRLEPRDERYRVGEDSDDLWLQGSAEHTLGSMYAGETLSDVQLPIRYIGFLTSFRREAGTYGKDMEGLIRLHQFDKLEMEIFSSKETSVDEHKLMLALQEYFVSELQLPYRVLQKCTFDIGKPNASGYDIDVWFPSQGKYRETHTADYMSDYQTRGTNTRYRTSDGRMEYVHTNDATAFALGRIMAAIIENYQDADGNVSTPEVLKRFMH
jgi:seryl-tRNA synthetase